MYFPKTYILAAPLRAVEIADEGGESASAAAVVTLRPDSRVTVLRRAGKPGTVEVQCGGRRYAVFLIDLTTRAALTT